MLFVEPLPLRDGASIRHPAWGVDARSIDGHFTIRWNERGGRLRVIADVPRPDIIERTLEHVARQ